LATGAPSESGCDTAPDACPLNSPPHVSPSPLLLAAPPQVSLLAAHPAWPHCRCRSPRSTYGLVNARRRRRLRFAAEDSAHCYRRAWVAGSRHCQSDRLSLLQRKAASDWRMSSSWQHLRLTLVARTLPAGVRIKEVYDRIRPQTCELLGDDPAQHRTGNGRRCSTAEPRPGNSA